MHVFHSRAESIPVKWELSIQYGGMEEWDAAHPLDINIKYININGMESGRIMPWNKGFRPHYAPRQRADNDRTKMDESIPTPRSSNRGDDSDICRSESEGRFNVNRKKRRRKRNARHVKSPGESKICGRETETRGVSAQKVKR